MSPDLTEKVKEWQNQKLKPLPTVFQFRLPCKWIRPLRDLFVACWNKEKVKAILKDQDVGIIVIADRPYCRGEVGDASECWDGLEQRCIDQCEYYFNYKKPSKYDKLKGFCTEQCKNFELFKPNDNYENLYKDFDELDILDILKPPNKRIKSIVGTYK